MVIFTAVWSLASGHQELWQRFNNGENLLFSEADFHNPQASGLFRALWESSHKNVRSLVGRLILACDRPLEQSPVLDDIVNNGNVRPLSKEAEADVDALLGNRKVVAAVDLSNLHVDADEMVAEIDAYIKALLGKRKDELTPVQEVVLKLYREGRFADDRQRLYGVIRELQSNDREQPHIEGEPVEVQETPRSGQAHLDRDNAADAAPNDGNHAAPDSLITPENVSNELLKSVLDAAFMEPDYDDKGYLFIREGGHDCVIFLNEKKDRISFGMYYAFKPRSSQRARSQCINRINDECILVKAIAFGEDNLRFEYDLFIAGGITKRNFVLALKRFCSIPLQAIREYGEDCVK